MTIRYCSIPWQASIFSVGHLPRIPVEFQTIDDVPSAASALNFSEFLKLEGLVVRLHGGGHLRRRT